MYVFMSAFICVCVCNCVFFALKIEQEAEKQRQPPLKQEQSEEVLDVSREEHQRKGDVEKEAYSSDNNITDQEEDEEDDDDDREAKPCLKPTLRPVTTAPSVSSASGNATPLSPSSESPCGIIAPHENSSHEAPPTEEIRPKIGLSLKLGLCVIKMTWLSVRNCHNSI